MLSSVAPSAPVVNTPTISRRRDNLRSTVHGLPEIADQETSPGRRRGRGRGGGRRAGTHAVDRAHLEGVLPAVVEVRDDDRALVGEARVGIRTVGHVGPGRLRVDPGVGRVGAGGVAVLVFRDGRPAVALRLRPAQPHLLIIALRCVQARRRLRRGGHRLAGRRAVDAHQQRGGCPVRPGRGVAGADTVDGPPGRAVGVFGGVGGGLDTDVTGVLQHHQVRGVRIEAGAGGVVSAR